jgi:hypothetical protein
MARTSSGRASKDSISSRTRNVGLQVFVEIGGSNSTDPEIVWQQGRSNCPASCNSSAGLCCSGPGSS